MTNMTPRGLLFLVMAASLAGCNGVSSSPTGPSPLSGTDHHELPGFSYGNGYTLTGVTLFGVISETTPTGQAPLADVAVYCDTCGAEGHTGVLTDANGYYSFGGDLEDGGGIWLSSRPTELFVRKEGFDDPAGQLVIPGVESRRQVTINGDTRYDIRLVRR